MSPSKELIDRATEYQGEIVRFLEKIGLRHCLTDRPVAPFRQLGESLEGLSAVDQLNSSHTMKEAEIAVVLECSLLQITFRD